MTVSYRCPACGSAVLSAVDLLRLPAELVKIKCTCKQSEMTISALPDGKVKIVSPCMICENPHSYTIDPTMESLRDLFLLTCPLSAEFETVAIGDANLVKAEMAESELRLLNFMEENQLADFSVFHGKGDTLYDPDKEREIRYVLADLDEEGKIFCLCDENEPTHTYTVSKVGADIVVSCNRCHGEYRIPLASPSFLDVDSIQLTKA